MGGLGEGEGGVRVGAGVLEVTFESLEEAGHPLFLVVSRKIWTEENEVDVEATARRCSTSVRSKLQHFAHSDWKALLQQQ